MSTILYPQITKKKAVPRSFPDSFRVISIDAELQHEQASFSHPARKEPLPDIIPRDGSRQFPTDDRYHKPHPYDCGFLRSNPRLLNEPICTVHTRTVTGPSDYRASGSFFYDEQIPTKTESTVAMTDYARRADNPLGLTRYGCNPYVSAATGIVPGTELDACRQRDDRAQENISFEHMYDSRQDPNYPARTKRHGGFVWKYPQPNAGSVKTAAGDSSVVKDGQF